MKKKVFSLMMTLVLAFMGVVRADELTVNDGTTTNYYVPVYGSYADTDGTNTEFIIPSGELSDMNGGSISGMTFYLSSSASAAWTATFQVYLAEVSATTLNSLSGPSAGTVVYTGTLDATGSTMEVTFNSPYTYNGGNLLVGTYVLNGGNYKSAYFYGVSATSGSSYYSYEGYYGWYSYAQSFLPKTTFTYTVGGGGGNDPVGPTPITGENTLFALQDGVVVETIEVGSRPNGAWMEPFTFQMRNNGNSAVSVSVIDFTPQEFLTAVAPAMPFTLAAGQTTDVSLNHEGTTETTLWQMVAIYEDSRTARVWNITAEPYTPEVPDVWEKPHDFGSISAGFSYEGIPSQITPTELHNDYTLPFPEIEEGVDAVYKFTVANDMILNAHVDTAVENGKVALYTEGFYGEGGPMATNNYTGLADAANGGGTGTGGELTVHEGTATNHRIPIYGSYFDEYAKSEFIYPATELVAMRGQNITSMKFYIQSHGYSMPGYSSTQKVFVKEVSNTSLSGFEGEAGATVVFEGTLTAPSNGDTEYVLNFTTPYRYNGGNLLVGVYNLTTGTYQFTYWYGENVANNAAYYGNSGYNPNFTSGTAQTFLPKTTFTYGGGRDSRTVILQEGFESGLGSWTMVNNATSTNVQTDATYAHSGSASFDFVYSYNPPQYLISPQLTGTDNGVEVEFYYRARGTAYTETFQVGYSTTTNATDAFTFSSEVSCNSTSWTTYNETFPAGTKYVAVKYTAYDMWHLFLDDFTFTAIDGGGSTPTGGSGLNVSAGPVIENLPIQAGTYYLVASATPADYTVYINADAMPCPAVEGFAFAPIPEDNASGLEPASVTLQWAVPDFASEWRLVFSTTYWPTDEENHPHTIITDWVRSQENSYTVTNLFNNTNYFWHVEFRNDGCPEGNASPVWGFTTHFNTPHGLVATPETIFEGETSTLTWNAIADRTYRSYRVYMDGELVHTTDPTPDPSANLSWEVPADMLTYNPAGYVFNVTALYDEGESAFSNDAIVKVSGYSAENGINGYVYEQDSVTGIPGVTVTITGTDEFGAQHTYTPVTDENGYYEVQVYVGTYTIAIASKPGYQDAEPYQNGPTFSVAHLASHDDMNFIMDEVFYAPSLVCADFVNVGGTEMVKVWWKVDGLNGEDGSVSSLNENFDNGQNDWTVIDADGDGWGWKTATEYGYPNCGHNNSAGFMASESYSSSYPGIGAIQPDNYLVSPKVRINNGDVFSFWAGVYSTLFGAEHYGVFVSTTGNTNPADFTMVAEWTFGRREGERGARDENDRVLPNDSWTLKSVDMSQYAGQDVYIAIRHFNCTDEWALLIDDVQLGAARSGDRALNHYRIYRTNCYYNGPYYEGDPGGTELLATAWVPDTSYIDVNWPYAPAGVYKYGVGVVYAGNQAENPNNRESEIRWSESRDVLFSDDFESGNLNNWTLVDNGTPAGQGWAYKNVTAFGWGDGENAHSGVGVACSWSWNGVPVNQDSYMITPLVEGATSINYFVNVSSSYPDHYQIMASSTGTNLSDFAVVFEESPRGTASSGAVKRSMTNGGGNRFDPWYERTVELPAGTKYVAIHHNDYDKNYLFIDDVVVYGAGGTPTPTPTPGDHVSCDNAYRLDRESCTMWSTMCSPCLDKDMETVVSVNVLLNSADPHAPLGTTVKFTNVNPEEEFAHPMGTITLMDTSYAVIDDFRKGEYDIEIYHYGYEVLHDHVSIWEPTDLRYVLIEILYGVKNVYVSRTGWAMWEPITDDDRNSREERHLEGYKVMCTSIDDEPIFNHNSIYEQPFCQLATDGPDPLVEGDFYKVKVCAVYSTGQSEWCEPVIWQYEPCDHWGPVDFVEGDANAQGNHLVWEFNHGHNQWFDPEEGGGEGGEASTFSYDFDNVANGNFGDWTTFQGTNGDSQNGWMTYDQHNYDYSGLGHNGSNGFVYSESYITGPNTAVHPDNYLVSPQVTLGSSSVLNFWVTDANDSYGAEHFTVEVSTSSNNNAADFNPVFEQTLLSKGTRAGRDLVNDQVWYNYSVDLSAYAGQQAYIAFHHFGCYDQWFLALDDVTLTAGAKDAKGGNSIAAYKNEPVYRQYSEDGIMLNFLALNNVDFRAYLLYNLTKDVRFVVVPEDTYGQFIITANEDRSDFGAMFEEFYSNAEANFAMLSKTDIMDQMTAWKTGIGSQNFLSITMDMYTSNIRTENDHCINSLPFCTTDLYEFESAYSGQTADDLEGTTLQDGCIGSSYNPSWYHMRVRTDGQFIIHLEGHDPNNAYTTRDVDFCIWGPFTDPYEPCVDQLTTDKIIDCSYSASYEEDIFLGYPVGEHDHGGSSLADGDITYHVPQAGEYYILMLTNYSNQPCVVSFTKTEGEGETDCDIVTPTNIIGFLITQDGEYLDIVPADAREYTHVGEFGEHEYCVRPIYPGPAILPDTNYYYSMGCPVCVTVGGGITPEPEVCAPVSNLQGMYMNLDGMEGLVIDWEEPQGAVAVAIYADGEYLGEVPASQHPIFIGFQGDVPEYTFTIGAVAIHADCESEMVETSVYYDDVEESLNKVALYPNPTNGLVKIYASGMRHITVASVLGQVVYDTDFRGDEFELDMNQWNAGVYVVRIATENGVSVKRVTLVK